MSLHGKGSEHLICPRLVPATAGQDRQGLRLSPAALEKRSSLRDVDWELLHRPEVLEDVQGPLEFWRFFRNLWASILSWSSAALLMGRSRSWGRGAGREAKLASQPDVWLKCSEDRDEGSFEA
ncbi:Ephrin-B2 [Manis pentadactyla]|nr:Ephrin-B2 [Manis pentadactyla]